MKAFAEWASGRPFRLWLLAVLGVFILPPVSPALLTLNALRRGPAAGLLALAVTVGAVAAISLMSGAPVGQTGVLTVLMLAFLVPAAAAGALLAWTRNFSFTFQATVIGTMLVVFLVFALFPGASQLGDFIREEWIGIFRDWGFSAEQLAALTELPAEAYISLLLAPLFATTLAALLLGFWWFTLVQQGVSFGEQFRALRLGRFASILMMVVVTLSQLVPFGPLQPLAPLALIGFLFPGLAVLHARVRSDNWPVSVLILVYVLLLFPFTTMAVVFGLSAVGLLDNFFALRARAGPED